MLSKSAAKAFFFIGTLACSVAFIVLSLDTIRKVPKLTNSENMSASVIRGKELWINNNCAGCHTLMGEGGYYAPELTRVYERRGESFIKALLKDPQAMYPGQRKMVKYPFTDAERDDLVSFFKWVGGINLNGFPVAPNLGAPVNATSSGSAAEHKNKPAIFNKQCVACHSLAGQGANIGPALDGIGSRRDKEFLTKWLADPKSIKKDSKMPNLGLSKEEITELVAFLSELKAPGVAK